MLLLCFVFLLINTHALHNPLLFTAQFSDVIEQAKFLLLVSNISVEGTSSNFTTLFRLAAETELEAYKREMHFASQDAETLAFEYGIVDISIVSSVPVPKASLLPDVVDSVPAMADYMIKFSGNYHYTNDDGRFVPGVKAPCLFCVLKALDELLLGVNESRNIKPYYSAPIRSSDHYYLRLRSGSAANKKLYSAANRDLACKSIQGCTNITLVMTAFIGAEEQRQAAWSNHQKSKIGYAVTLVLIFFIFVGAAIGGHIVSMQRVARRDAILQSAAADSETEVY